MISKVFASAKLAIENVLKELQIVLANHDLGEEFLPPSTDYPGVFWVPMGGPITPAKQIGSDSAMRRAAEQQSVGVNELAQRNVAIRVHVWNGDFESTETLMAHYAAALRRAVTGYSFNLAHEAWTIGPSPNTKEPVENVSSGSMCILTIEIRMPFTFEPIAVSAPPHHPTITPAIPAAA